MGELRQRSRIALPLVAAAGGMIVPVAIFLAFNAGHSSAEGWGTAMATDTAFALGILALVAKAYPRLRTFILTAAIFDDLIALVVIATAYSQRRFVQGPRSRRALVRSSAVDDADSRCARPPLTIILAAATWVALHESGIHPTVGGLALGLALSAYPPARSDLEQTTAVAREFREQPTAELARQAQRQITATVSPNERVQNRLHPWTSYVIVPLFALANAGTHISGDILSSAATSPITLGIVFGYVVGSRSASSPPPGWPRAAGSGPEATRGLAQLLRRSRRGRNRLHGLAARRHAAFHGEQLTEAKLGILAAAIGATLVSSTYFMTIKRLPQERMRAASRSGGLRRSSTSRCPSTRRSTTSAGRRTRR